MNGNIISIVTYASQVCSSGEGPKVVVSREALAVLLRLAKESRRYTQAKAIARKLPALADREQPGTQREARSEQ